MALLDDRIRRWSVDRAAEPALCGSGGSGAARYSWRELEALTAGTTARLEALGATAAGPALVVVSVSSSVDRVLRLVAALRTRLPVLVLDEGLPEVLRTSITDRLLRDGMSTIEWTADAADPGLAAARRGDGGAAVAGIAPGALLLTTGGSSGRPRVVVDTGLRSSAARPFQVRLVSVLDWRPFQRQLVVGSLAHAASLTFFIEGLADGNTLVIQDGFRPSAALDLIEEHRIEWLQVTPYHLRRLASAPGTGPDPGRLRSIRSLVHMGAACPHATKRRWHELLGPERVYEVYGASEGIGVTVARGDEWEPRAGTVGRGFFTRVSVVDGQGRPLGPYREGDVYLRRGGSGHGAYLFEARRDERRLPDGSTTLGDRGHLDDSGYLYLSPRQLSSISVAGVTVLPSEIEAELLECPGVVDAAVVGLPDERLGERVVALVVPSGLETPTARQVEGWIRSRLSPAHVPRVVHLVPEIPRTGAGKLLRERAEVLAASLSSGDPVSAPGARKEGDR